MHLTSQYRLEWDDLFARAKFVMRENKAKSTFKVGEFKKFLHEHGVLEQFVPILDIAMEEEKYAFYSLQENYCSVAPSYWLVKFACKGFKCNDCCIVRKNKGV